MEAMGVDDFAARARGWRDRLAAHSVYAELQSLDDVRQFMECHVFAVWDFMSLLKRLQRELTCVAVPWVPAASAKVARLINQIVTDEESDEDGSGGVASHFEIYCRAMREVGADLVPITDLVATAARGGEPRSEMTPEPARAFVDNTFRIVRTGAIHEVAAAFTFGREDVVPEMFRAVMQSLADHGLGPLPHLRYYLERHIGIDQMEHFPSALSMMGELCRGDERKWREAMLAVDAACSSRVALWDGVLARIRAARAQRRNASGREPTALADRGSPRSVRESAS